MCRCDAQPRDRVLDYVRGVAGMAFLSLCIGGVAAGLVGVAYTEPLQWVSAAIGIAAGAGLVRWEHTRMERGNG